MEKRQKTKHKWNLYQKFSMVIICVGIIPIAVLSTVILNTMFKEYSRSLKNSYEQNIRYAAYSVESVMDSFNDISKICYYYKYSSDGDFNYNYMNYDNLRKILTGENYEEESRESKIQMEMDTFLGNVVQMNSSISAAHFVCYNQQKTASGTTINSETSYHKGRYGNYFRDEEIFRNTINMDQIDLTSRSMLLLIPHYNNYFNAQNDLVLTIGRNYYNLKGVVGREPYIGTLFIDFNLEQLDEIFSNIDLYENGVVYICNSKGDCFYSSDTKLIGKNLKEEGINYEQVENPSEIFLDASLENYDLHLYYKIDGTLHNQEMKKIQKIMYLFIVVSVIGLLVGSIVFSRRLTKPIRKMMESMSRIETGQFKVQLPVNSEDEIGILSERFNQMSTELEKYINQSYVAQIKQKEAELNALKSQIYPHFLYNTLEVIRMTAVNHHDEMVEKMIESLSDQIRYVIGTVNDVIPLAEEIEFLSKYIYLINCRYGDKVIFQTEIGNVADKKIPKLILQPIVENAFIHGIKPKEGKGRILLTAEIIPGTVEGKEDKIEITVLDNGLGIDEKGKKELEELLLSDKPGKKNKYQWESIGLKNVHDRLRFLYGNEYGITLLSNIGMGTAVKVTIPGNIEEETKHAEDDHSRR